MGKKESILPAHQQQQMHTANVSAVSTSAVSNVQSPDQTPHQHAPPIMAPSSLNVGAQLEKVAPNQSHANDDPDDNPDEESKVSGGGDAAARPSSPNDDLQDKSKQ